MYGYNYDFITDGKNHFIGSHNQLAIDMQQQKVVKAPLQSTLLLHKDMVKKLCKSLVQKSDKPKFADVRIGDYIQFSADGGFANGSFDGFVISRSSKDFDTTGDEWNYRFSFLAKRKGYTLCARVPAHKVLECLLNNI